MDIDDHAVMVKMAKIIGAYREEEEEGGLLTSISDEEAELIKEFKDLVRVEESD